MNAKLIRGQVRQIVKEELNGVLSTELVAALEKRLVALVNQKLNALHKQVEQSLVLMDKKVNDGVSYLIRHTGEMPLKVKLDSDKK